MSRLEAMFTPGHVLTDGAWGTEFLRRGLRLGESADLWNLTRPDVVETVARGYVDVGCQVILTNTFRANPIALADHGEAHRAREINRRGAEISRLAARGKARVFGSLGPAGWGPRGGRVEPRDVIDAYRVQAEGLAEGGVDALAFETLGGIEEARLAVCAARPIGLPVVVSFTFDTNGRTLCGEAIEDVTVALKDEPIDAIGANCGTGPDAFLGVCERLRATTALRIWMKPNAGLPTIQGGEASYPTGPAEFAATMSAIHRAGATFLGGCCGTDPAFIREIREILR